MTATKQRSWHYRRAMAAHAGSLSGVEADAGTGIATVPGAEHELEAELVLEAEHGLGAEGAQQTVASTQYAIGWPHQSVQLEIRYTQTAIDVVQELATQTWRETARERFARLSGERFWEQVHAAWRPAHCKKLAAAARNLGRIDPAANCGSVLARESAREAVKRTPLGTVLVDQVSATARLDAQALAAVLRVAGIVLCEDQGCLTACQCLKDLAAGASPAALRVAITQVCEGYLAHDD